MPPPNFLYSEEGGREVSTSMLEASDEVDAPDEPEISWSLSFPKSSSSTSSPFRLQEKGVKDGSATKSVAHEEK
jgi:hypothetical protein